jgi:ribosome recycling factor
LSDEVIQAAEDHMQKTIEHTREDFSSVRTGRASPVIVQKIIVDYYGAATPLQQLASINVTDPRTLTITPYDRGALGAVEKGIQASDLGITPSNDGANIRLSFPPLTEERRKELIKSVRDRAEHGRVAVRGIRRNSKEELERQLKDEHVSEDTIKWDEKRLDTLTQKYVSEIDEMLKRKEAELLEV